jgi:predicted ester cyclase
MSVEENKAIVRQLLDELYNRHNVDVIDKFYDDRFFEDGAQGRERWKQYRSHLRYATPSWSVTVHDLTAEGSKVVARLTHHVPARSFGHVVPNGASVLDPTVSEEDRWEVVAREVVPLNWAGITVYQFEDGRIVKGWSVMDMLGLRKQLGFPVQMDQIPVITRDE